MHPSDDNLLHELEPIATAAANGSPPEPADGEALLRRARASGSPQLVGLAQLIMGHAWQHVGALLMAQRLFRRAALTFQQAGLSRQHVEAMIEVGRACNVAGDVTQALAAWTASLAHARDSHDMYNCARVYLGVGQVYVGFGDHATALQYHELALKLALPLAQDRLCCEALINVAGDAYRAGLHARAIEALDEAERLLAGPVHNRVWSAEVCNYRGLIEYALGNDAAALPLLETAFALHNENDNLWGKAHALLALGRAWARQGDVASAERNLLGARELARHAGMLALQQDCAELLAELARDRNDAATALRRLRELHALRSEPAKSPQLRLRPQAINQLKTLEARSLQLRARLRYSLPDAPTV
ncbi:hypothetical protein SAMN02745857_03222 [Andreprevotia lacus DSM 23236]|jgi:hypothetical protein|uniref:Tetratricopeptide repeat-containing protein n=1 Tax=Andreprevotia lacus DSM 23236 TaxID=1121001 RepID=A0A1W1XX01_9NEIS|nr:tetratricopeptide repeat protein [Andreprevotia lacus]SMC28374.1 hypothetical protein SAMN02745857_03222 [Andreprevotia lacus DSM 23236]